MTSGRGARTTVYVEWPAPLFLLVELACGAVLTAGLATYLALRRR